MGKSEPFRSDGGNRSQSIHCGNQHGSFLQKTKQTYYMTLLSILCIYQQTASQHSTDTCSPVSIATVCMHNRHTKCLKQGAVKEHVCIHNAMHFSHKLEQIYVISITMNTTRGNHTEWVKIASERQSMFSLICVCFLILHSCVKSCMYMHHKSRGEIN